jgi:hypothetical protein
LNSGVNKRYFSCPQIPDRALGRHKFSEWNKDTLDSETIVDTITGTWRINNSSVGIQNYHCQLRGNVCQRWANGCARQPIFLHEPLRCCWLLEAWFQIYISTALHFKYTVKLAGPLQN